MSLYIFRCWFFEQKGHLLLLFIFSYTQNSFAQKENFCVQHFLSSQPKAYTLNHHDYFVVQDSIADLKEAVYARSLMRGYLIVKAKKGSYNALKNHVGLANPNWKLSPRLAITDTKNIRSYFSGKGSAFIVGTPRVTELIQFLSNENIRVIKSDTRSGSIVVILDDHGQFEKILHHEWVTFVDIDGISPREETLNSTQDLSVNHIGWIHSRSPELNGESLTVSVRERTMEKTDIDLVGRIVQSPLEDPLISFHANQMATVIAGGGNSSEESMGIAWGSRVSSASFNSDLPDPDEYFRDYGISVQNHSYGFEIENFYGAEARAFDMQCNTMGELLHVFSAGNRGEESSYNGPYTGLPEYATLTGNLKMAKNVLVVGGHYDDYSIDTRNSRGPAYDGRIKPEVVAFGPEGTSDGAAYVSGIALLLQDAYRRKFQSLPPSMLIKLTLSLTADDLGNPGPDYITGYGAVNARNALRLFENGQFDTNEVARNNSREFIIDVPTRTKRLRVGLAWNDPAAEAGSPAALVNDLDLEITEIASGKLSLPWILNYHPHIDSLRQPARKGKDNINNLEIITVDDPPSGQYRVKVTGAVVQDLQKYSVAFMTDSAEFFAWTFPMRSNRLEAGKEIKIRWNTTYSGNAELHASSNGADFRHIMEVTELGNEFAPWTVPDGINQIQFKMVIAGREYISEKFLASPILNFEVGYNCDQAALLQWNRLPQADEFMLFNLGEQYLKPVLASTDTSFSFSPGELSDYFALAPVLNGSPGRRSLTYNYKATGALCYYRSFDAELTADAAANVSLHLTTLFNVRKIVFEKKVAGSFINIASLNASKDLQYAVRDEELTDGLTTYRAAIHLLNGDVIYTNEDVLVYANSATFFVYPNPLLRQQQPLHVLTDGDGVRFELFDSHGKLVEERELVGTLFDLDLSGVPAGLYFYRFVRNSSIKSGGKIVLH